MLSNWWRRPKIIIIIIIGCDFQVKHTQHNAEPLQRNALHYIWNKQSMNGASTWNVRANDFGFASVVAFGIWRRTSSTPVWKCFKKWKHLSTALLAANRIRWKRIVSIKAVKHFRRTNNFICASLKRQQSIHAMHCIVRSIFGMCASKWPGPLLRLLMCDVCWWRVEFVIPFSFGAEMGKTARGYTRALLIVANIRPNVESASLFLLCDFLLFCGNVFFKGIWRCQKIYKSSTGGLCAFGRRRFFPSLGWIVQQSKLFIAWISRLALEVSIVALSDRFACRAHHIRHVLSSYSRLTGLFFIIRYVYACGCITFHMWFVQQRIYWIHYRAYADGFFFFFTLHTRPNRQRMILRLTETHSYVTLN